MTEEVSKAIGSTPLIRLDKLSAEVGAEVYAKYEAANPGGSIKDRAALMMVERAEEHGRIVPGKSVLIEPTSGNTGVALAMIGAARGYEVVLTMPESMSRERRALLAAYGATLVLTPAAEGMAGAVARAEEIAREREGAWIVGQFENPDNPRAHELTTGPEIERALGRVPDYVVVAAGTGGTITGLAHYFKRGRRASCDEGGERGQDARTERVARGDAADPGAAIPPTRCFAVEPAESPLIGQALRGEPLVPGAHGIQGIGANFIPAALDLAALDGALAVSTQDALAAARWLAAEEGLLVGISTGANIAGVRELVRRYPEAKGAAIVTVAVDTGERYLSTELFA